MQSTAQSLADLFNDARALEKVLKLVQGVVQIVGASASASASAGGVGGQRSRMVGSREELVRWNMARGHIALCK